MMQQQRQVNPAEQEWLSALLDGELEDSEAERAARQLVQDYGRMRCWSEYCLIGDALRGDIVMQPGFMQRLHAALAAEPTVLAPMRKKHTARITRPLAWAAAAAAVAAVTWTVWTALPPQSGPIQHARNTEPVMIQASHVMPYVDAHQDFSQAVTIPPELAFTRVTLVSTEAGR